MPEAVQPQVLLGIDYGRKRIGLAVGQTITQSAQALDILPAQAGIPHWQTLQRVIAEWQIEGIVVGLPLNMDGSTQNLTQEVRDFVSELKKHCDLPIFMVDERLTTVEAKQQISQQGRHQLQQQRVDSYAAKLILEAWLQRQ